MPWPSLCKAMTLNGGDVFPMISPSALSYVGQIKHTNLPWARGWGGNVIAVSNFCSGFGSDAYLSPPDNLI